MTSLLVLCIPTNSQSFMLIYGFLFELWVSNLNEKEENEVVLCDGDGLGPPNYRCIGLSFFSPPYHSPITQQGTHILT